MSGAAISHGMAALSLVLWSDIMRKIELIKDRHFYERVLAIMLPVAMQQAINMGVNMMDTIMLGSFGEVQLSASSLANSFYSIFQIFCMGIIAGCSILVSQHYGAEQMKQVKQTFALALRLTLFFGAVFAAVTWLFPDAIMRLFSSDPEVIAAGVLYLRVTVYIYLIHGVGLVIAQLMRSVGQAALGLYVSLISFVVNVAANWIFIFGKLGAPKMEIQGAAVGTLIARSVELIATGFFVLKMDKKIGLKLGDFFQRVPQELLRRYLKVGLPALCSDAMLSFGRTATSMIIGQMGTVAVAANSMVQVVDRLFTVVTGGISNAAGIVIGHTIGSGDKHKAQQQGESLFIIALGISILSALLFLFVGPATLSLYNVAEATLVVTKKLMITYSVLIVFQCVGTVMTKGVLRGGGDTRFLLVADVAFLWLASIPLGYTSGIVMGWPIFITSVFLRIDDIIKSVWCIGRLNSGKWIHDVVQKADSE